MLPIERRKEIEKLISEHTHLKISELSELLGVSEMTIHRDLTPLIEEGQIIKTFGGISCAQSVHRPGANTCTYCHRENRKHFTYQLILKNHTTETTCCAHCGLLRHRQLADQVVQAMTQDFLTRTTINAKQATYVLDTSLMINCCQPQALTFEWAEHAKKFTHGFGGQTYSFQDATDIIYKKMANG